tara:strand:+ start:4353 stop:5042 length:690 start_codon:yes stop_codon:yes gene_type:complete
MKERVFNILKAIDVNDMTEKKGRFTYLSWAHAVNAVKSKYPDTTWKNHEFVLEHNGGKYTVPYMLDPITGHGFVKCTVTIEGHSQEQTHPILNHLNKPISKPDAFAINTAQMRCLAKCLSLHGLGLYIYQGEDLPVLTKEEEAQEKVEEVYSRPETLLNGKKPVEGGITVEQNVKLDRLSRDPALKGTDTQSIIRTFIDTMPTEEKAEEAIEKLKTKIKETKQTAKEAA